MRKRRSGSVAALMAVVAATVTWFAAPAYAQGTQDVTASVPLTLTDWDNTAGLELRLPRFDSSRGVLDSVHVELEAQAQGSASVENKSTNPNNNIQLTLGARLGLGTPSELVALGFPTELTAETAKTLSLPGYDGVVDFGGTSGTELPPLDTVKTYVADYTDPAKLAPFIGNGDLVIPVTGTATSLAKAGGNVISSFETMLGASVSVVYTYKEPHIKVTKQALTPVVRDGDPATFKITVTNDGETGLGAVTVTDPLAADCEQAPVLGELAMGASFEFTCLMPTAPVPAVTVPGPVQIVTNTVTANGQAGGKVVTDTATADVQIVTPAIKVTKVAVPTSVRRGESASFDIEVTNTGNIALTDVVVTDPLATGCDTVVPSLAVGATVAASHCTVTNLLADLVNVVNVTGDSPVGPVSDSATATVTVIQPKPHVSIVKKVNGDDANTAPGVTVDLNSPLTFTFTVLNDGDDVLSGIAVIDDVLGAITCPATVLIPGASMDCLPKSGTQAVVATSHNTATVTATSTTGAPVPPASDVAYHSGRELLPCPAVDGLLIGLTFRVNNGPARSSLSDIVAKPGDTITVEWTGVAAGAEGCCVNLAQHATNGLVFDKNYEQPLVTQTGCAARGTFSLTLKVIDSGKPNQFDLITGPALPSVGPIGGYYSSILNGAINHLISAGTSPAK